MNQGQVLLIEGHPLLRQTLRQVLANAGLEAVTEAADAAAGVRLAVRLRPDFVVVDMTMADVNGLVLSQLIHELLPQSKVVLLVDDSATYCPLAVEKGVAACISKRAAAHELPLALRSMQKSVVSSQTV